ncbi:D-isomer specific 2-hydroxyacid dehydrogenase family protein [Streptomyces sp. KAU_LT]|uniref:NAD(P)-dependent oxidoreductase n=1 Tax=Streptomyces sp. KAU_LT TaxID=3046669 RepID=UPI0024B7343F|nr:D-isomer specific 2-hydroxyacid dehydrogenase family protein [Streptomyces sp. KAU_LT]MDI9835086.1 D-isomer specific 2-hydroxyacid dehydrogenase family protein [Streptomyces sp. KAU_LT]
MPNPFASLSSTLPSLSELVALEDRGRGFHVLKCRAGIPLTRSVLDRATSEGLRRRLVLVGRAAAGTDTFDLAAARRLGVSVRTAPGANAGAVAELTVSLMLDALREIARRDRDLRAGAWGSAVEGLPVGSLGGARVGLVGSGAIARRTAELVRAFGAEVWVLGSPRFTPERAAGRPGRRVDTLTELLTGCDVVSVHVPATPETEGLIGAAELRLMRPGSVLINTARASVVREEALDRALRDPLAGPARAAVDVFENEGAGFSSPLADNPYCTLSPHVAGMTHSAMRAASDRLLAEFERFLVAGDCLAGNDSSMGGR